MVNGGCLFKLSLKDFVDIIKAKVHPVRNRELRAEVLFGSLDIKSYYDQLGLYVSGLVSSRNPDRSLNHCWRFIRRSDPWCSSLCRFCACFSCW